MRRSHACSAGLLFSRAVGTLIPVGMTRYHHGRVHVLIEASGGSGLLQRRRSSGGLSGQRNSPETEVRRSVAGPGDDRLEGLGEVGELPS